MLVLASSVKLELERIDNFMLPLCLFRFKVRFLLLASLIMLIPFCLKTISDLTFG